jgi:hypothetical protein
MLGSSSFRWPAAVCLVLGGGGCTGASSYADRNGATSDAAAGGNAGGSSVVACSGDPVTINRRLVRLTLRQIVASTRALLGPELADQLVQTYQIPDLSARAFPPLSSQEEGTFITEGLWSKSENIAKSAAQYVRDNYAAVTSCQPTDTTDDCALAFIGRFAEEAFRRPLDAEERSSLLQVYTESRSFGADVAEAAQQAVWATLSSPHFLYRRELGDTAAGEASALTSYEMATALSFFLTDAPPDAPLLEAAAQGTLASPEGIAAQVERLLATEAVQTNLLQAVLTYFGIGNLDQVIIDPIKAPTFTVGLKNAMYRETEEFLRATLFSGPLDELLTSRKTVVNPDLAALYGVAFPAEQPATADNFVAIELPAARAGLLTQAGFLTARARPDKDSVVGRGLMVAATMLCASNPDEPPDSLQDQISAATTQLADKTEREKADYRLSQPTCAVCHRNFDAYGLVLENFGLIGAYRAVDELGRPIDASAVLPAEVGGANVEDAPAMARALTASGAFTTCMTRNLLKYAIAEGNVNRDDCAVRNVSQKVLQQPATFASLIREIALSQTLGMRRAQVLP